MEKIYELFASVHNHVAISGLWPSIVEVAENFFIKIASEMAFTNERPWSRISKYWQAIFGNTARITYAALCYLGKKAHIVINRRLLLFKLERPPLELSPYRRIGLASSVIIIMKKKALLRLQRYSGHHNIYPELSAYDVAAPPWRTRPIRYPPFRKRNQ